MEQNQKEHLDLAIQHSDINGWGIDADPENDPTYPIKHYNGADHDRLNYPRLQQQPINVEILHSIERPSVSTVFGTSTPPRGLSGILRRRAYKLSEGQPMHWMTLILADRVDAIEGFFEDFAHARIPNLFAERGFRAAWKYDRKATAGKLAAGIVTSVAVITGVVAVFRRK